MVAGRSTSSAPCAGSSSTTRASRIQTPRHEPIHSAHSHRRGAGRLTFEWGSRTYVMAIVNATPGLLLRRRRARRRGDPVAGGCGDGAPGRRRGRGRHRRRRRVDPARSFAGRRRGGERVASSRSSPRSTTALPDACHQHRHDQGGRRRGGARRGRLARQRRVGRRRGRRPAPARRRAPRSARAHAQPRRAALHDAHGRDRRRPPARDRSGRRGRDRVGRADRRPGLRLRQDADAQPRADAGPRDARACWAGRSCSATSRKSTLGRVLDLPPDQRVEATLATTALGIAARRRHGPGPRRARERPGGAHGRRDRARRRRAGSRGRRRAFARMAADDRPIVLRNMVFQGTHGVLEQEQRDRAAVRVDVELAGRPPAAPASTTTSSRPSTTAGCSRPAARSSNRRLPADRGARRGDRAASCWPTSRARPRSTVQVRKPQGPDRGHASTGSASRSVAAG